jgi:hypothetical protein
MDDLTIKIASDFSPRLGGRWIRLGPFSGEEFYVKILDGKFKEAHLNEKKLNIFLDGTTGYGSSFLDQSFGELSRQYGIEEVKKTIVFHTEFFVWVVSYINKEIWEKK